MKSIYYLILSELSLLRLPSGKHLKINIRCLFAPDSAIILSRYSSCSVYLVIDVKKKRGGGRGANIYALLQHIIQNTFADWKSGVIATANCDRVYYKQHYFKETPKDHSMMHTICYFLFGSVFVSDTITEECTFALWD